jgi:hypothetical protein
MYLRDRYDIYSLDPYTLTLGHRMTDTLFKEVRYDLNALIKFIELGEIGLPDIQRPFVWKNTKIRNLFDSMYKGFPIGYLLFWQNDLSPDSRPIGVESKQKIPRLLIVDGHQPFLEQQAPACCIGGLLVSKCRAASRRLMRQSWRQAPETNGVCTNYDGAYFCFW